MLFRSFNIAKDLNASVRLLHIYFTPFLSTTFPDTETYNSEIEEEQMQQEITDIVKVQMSKFEANIKNKILKGELADVKFSSEITDGIPEEEIRNWTKVNKPLMIVMGTRGKSEKEIDLIGSVTAEVIDTSQIPVFAIPENTTVKSFSDIKKIGYVTNFDQRDLLGFYHLINMQGLNDKKIAFICLIKDSNETLKLDRIKDYFLKNFPDNEFEFGVIKEDELLQDTDKYIKEEQIDLLVITTHKRNIFARLFNPSIAHKMIFHSDTPLLVIRN